MTNHFQPVCRIRILIALFSPIYQRHCSITFLQSESKQMKIIFALLMLCLSASKLLRIPLNGSLQQAYHLTLNFGSQQIPNKLMIDTGSSLTVLQCINCIKCGGKGRNNLYSFEESLSSTRIDCQSREAICEGNCRSNQEYCQYQVSYAQGSSVYGDIIKDQVFFSNQIKDQFRAYFGCIDYQNNVHGEGELNILGLSPVARQNILYPFFQSNPSYQYQFSTCLSSTNGYLQIGVNAEYSNITPKWTTKFYTSQRKYRVDSFESLIFGSLSVTPTNLKNGIIIDTGTTYYIFPQEMFKKIAQQINNRCGRLRGKCYPIVQDPRRIIIVVPANNNKASFDRDLDKNFQKLDITIGGVKTEVKPSQYFYQLQQQQGQAVIAATFSYTSGESARNPLSELNSMIILGMSWLRNKKIVFNLKDQTIKAYYDQNCTYTPAPKEKDQSLMAVIIDTWEYIKMVPIEYLVFSLFILVAVVFIIKKNLDAIKKKLKNLKKCIIRTFKRAKKPQKQNKSAIELNEESVREEKKAYQQEQNVTVVKTMKKRGRNRSIKKKKPVN